MATALTGEHGTMGGSSTAVIRWWDEAQNEEAQAIVKEQGELDDHIDQEMWTLYAMPVTQLTVER